MDAYTHRPAPRKADGDISITLSSTKWALVPPKAFGAYVRPRSPPGRRRAGFFLEDAVYVAEYFSQLSIPDTQMLTSASAHRATPLKEERAHPVTRIVRMWPFRVIH